MFYNKEDCKISARTVSSTVTHWFYICDICFIVVTKSLWSPWLSKSPWWMGHWSRWTVLTVPFWQLRYGRGNSLKYYNNQPLQWGQISSVITDASDSMLWRGEYACHTPEFHHILSYILALGWVFNIHWLAIPSSYMYLPCSLDISCAVWSPKAVIEMGKYGKKKPFYFIYSIPQSFKIWIVSFKPSWISCFSVRQFCQNTNNGLNCWFGTAVFTVVFTKQLQYLEKCKRNLSLLNTFVQGMTLKRFCSVFQFLNCGNFQSSVTVSLITVYKKTTQVSKNSQSSFSSFNNEIILVDPIVPWTLRMSFLL